MEHTGVEKITEIDTIPNMKKPKIILVEPFLLEDRLEEPFFFSQFEYSVRKICIVKITLDNGISGWGEGYGPGLVVKAGIEQLIPVIIGRDPLQIENIWQDMHRMIYDYARKGILLSSISAIDIALWDIKGKILNQPICTLLGGRKREMINTYATGLYFTNGGDQVEKLKREALKYKAMGFKATKMKVGLGLERDIRHIRAVREAIGDDMKLMIDANHAYSLIEAHQLIDKIQDLNIGWFEEPLINEDYDGYAELRKSGKIPIAAGECEYLKYGALEMLSKKCVDILQPDTCACGGITEFKKIMAIAQAHHTNITPHNWGTGIAIAANLHIAGNIDLIPHRLFPGDLLLEFDCSPNKLRDELLVENFKPVNGQLIVPSGPGLGINVREDIVNKYRVK